MVWQKGDVIELDESLPCGFRLVSRGGNLAVVVDFEKSEVKRCAQTLNLIENMQLVGGMAEEGWIACWCFRFQSVWAFKW
jgi:hypothetical protein